jgi:hypothetical protein
MQMVSPPFHPTRTFAYTDHAHLKAPENEAGRDLPGYLPQPPPCAFCFQLKLVLPVGVSKLFSVDYGIRQSIKLSEFVKKNSIKIK